MHVVATAGHVDHGKSTLVRALTGMEPDRWAEERRRGMTIDLGFAWTELPSGTTVAFVDVPGHERFVTTMLAGVGPVPAVLLVVAADEGFMPQSAEHVDALCALGVHHGLLVITRTDLMDPELAGEDARSHLAGTPLADLPTVGVSAATGAGMAELRAALDALVHGLPPPDLGADVRLWVDRAFTIRGAGTVVTGTLGAGRIRVDDELELATTDGVRRVGVRGLQCLGAPVAEARGVSRVAVNLRGVPREAVARGDVLLTPGAWLVTDLLDVRMNAAVHSGHRRRGGTPIAPGPATLPGELSLHVGAAGVPARVRPLGADTARLRLPRPLPLRIGDRGVLRDPGRREVVTGLTVLDVAPPPLRRRGAAARRAEELTGVDGTPSAAAELARRGLARRTDLGAMGIARADVDALAARVPGAAGWLVDPHRSLRPRRGAGRRGGRARRRRPPRPRPAGRGGPPRRRAPGCPARGGGAPVPPGRDRSGPRTPRRPCDARRGGGPSGRRPGRDGRAARRSASGTPSVHRRPAGSSSSAWGRGRWHRW